MSDITKPGGETLALPGGAEPGGYIGPFKVLQPIGEGGFGSVFEAEQEHPVRRRVALKIIKLGMDTREVIVRFEAERQALAMMDHPHIARVLDAGATDSGRPYFVMELVKGESITSYSSKHKLPIEQRLQLFEQVCAAVQHAHTKGIIHRDLKPNNVLVSTQDNAPFAKVIDFGIAKATSGRLTDRTMFTEINLMMGTPAYMSPEQAEGSADIDTRTDIYSLGVILYELLTDSTPLDSNTLRSASYAEVQRIIREVEPPRPSARLSQSITTQADVASRRQTEPRKLSGTVRGELDWIVMKAIEKDRVRRYETPAALAADVRRYLDGEAVLAAPPSTVYRARKYVMRHKGAMAAVSLIVISLLAGIIGFASQAHIARQQAERAQKQEQIAQQNANDLKQVADFEAAMLGQVNPVQAGKLLADDMRKKYAASLVRDGVPEDGRAQQLAAFDAIWQRVNATDAARGVIDQSVLRPAAALIDAKFAAQPLIAAQLRMSLAARYSDMGLLDAAIPLQRAALATRRQLLGENNPETATAELDMGSLLQRKGEFAQSEPYYLAALKTARAVAGEDNEYTLAILGNLALMYGDQGRFALAEHNYRKVLEARQRVLGKSHPDTLLAMQNLGALLRTERKYDQAEPYLREAAAGQEKVSGPNADYTFYAEGNLVLLAEARGQYDTAERQIADVLKRARRTFGEEYPTTLLASIIMGGILDREGKHDLAESLLVGVESASGRTLTGDNAFWFGMLRWHLGHARSALGRYPQAEADLLAAQSLLARPHVAQEPDDLRECTQSLIELYTRWDHAEPGKGYATKAAQWQQTLNAIKASELSTKP